MKTIIKNYKQLQKRNFVGMHTVISD